MRKKHRRNMKYAIHITLAGVLVIAVAAGIALAKDETPKSYAGTAKVYIENPIKEVAAEYGREPEVYTITAYCPCEECCGEYALNRPIDEYGNEVVIGAGGVKLSEGIHCASPLPFGTRVEIEGVGRYEVQDRTADWVAKKYDDKVIDIYFDTHEEAENFTKRKALVVIL